MRFTYLLVLLQQSVLDQVVDQNRTERIAHHIDRGAESVTVETINYIRIMCI